MLIQVLSDVDPIIRDCAVGALVNFWRTIIALGYTGSDEQTVEVLLQALNHDDPWVRRSAAIALGVIKQPADVIVPALVGKLDDEAWEGGASTVSDLLAELVRQPRMRFRHSLKYLKARIVIYVLAQLGRWCKSAPPKLWRQSKRQSKRLTIHG